MLLQKQQPGLIGGRTVFCLKCPPFIYICFGGNILQKGLGLLASNVFPYLQTNVY